MYVKLFYLLSDMQLAAQGSLDELEQQIYSMSSYSESYALTSQLVNCHAVIADGELHTCARVNTVPSYLEVNRVVSTSISH